MSSFKQITRHPVTGRMQMATHMDNYFGEHKYGVKFDGEDIVYTETIFTVRKDSDEDKTE